MIPATYSAQRDFARVARATLTTDRRGRHGQHGHFRDVAPTRATVSENRHGQAFQLRADPA